MTFGLSEALKVLGPGRNLSAQETSAAVAEIMAGEASDTLISAFLTALHFKGESADELTGAVQAVRDRMSGWDSTGLPASLLDTCGTGGDGANTVNISTAAAIVVAACGVPIAKHGNRSASGNSGSAEVLNELGVVVEAEPTVVRRCLVETGITFLFAPKYHPALRFAGPVRRQLPFRTLFNLIGPLANPSRPDFQLVGVPGEHQAELVASALARLGCRRAAVVTGSDGLDEVTLGGPTRVRWVDSGVITLKSWHADDFGLAPTDAGDLRVSGPPESAQRIARFLAGEKGAVRAMVLANSAAALLVAGVVDSLRDGVERAAEVVDSGAGAALLERWGKISRSEA